ncbi:MAG: hypothetical protein VKN56_00235 [Cyanobacteriota bacterium]|nr:hypothetical protein [Cyanobacteriota bacterium]
MLLDFEPSFTTLLCDLRAPGTSPYCPDTPAGQGTMALGVIDDEFTVDQTGLSITEDPTGLPSVSFSYTAPFPIAVGRRNFLALAFRPLVPIQPGTTVTYSLDVLPNATLVTKAFSCTNSSDGVVDCSSPQPSRSFKLNPVPGPLAVGALPMMALASHRIRRRIALTRADR